MKVSLSTYPDSVSAYPAKPIELIIEVESTLETPLWLEAEVRVEPGMSFALNKNINSGRFRLGICEGRDTLSKSIKLYTGHNVRPYLYKCNVSVFAFDKNGISAGREDKHTLIKAKSK